MGVFHHLLPLDNFCEMSYICSMKQPLVAKLKLHATPEQFKTLRATQLAYREIRTRFKIPAQMACSIPRQVGATHKALWTKVQQNAQARQQGRTKKRYRGLDQPPTYVSPTLTYQLGHDYGFKTEQRVSLLTLQGRLLLLPYTGYDKHVALIEQGASLGSAQLWYDKPRRQFYLLVSLQVETPDPTPEMQTHVVGVDVGIRYLAVTSTTQGDCRFYPGKRLVPQANHYARLRQRLQKKGTRSATRRLIAISVMYNQKSTPFRLSLRRCLRAAVQV